MLRVIPLAAVLISFKNIKTWPGYNKFKLQMGGSGNHLIHEVGSSNLVICEVGSGKMPFYKSSALRHTIITFVGVRGQLVTQ